VNEAIVTICTPTWDSRISVETKVFRLEFEGDVKLNENNIEFGRIVNVEQLKGSST
jgi:hypothetical protein